MSSQEQEEMKKEDNFEFSGEESYYGRLCKNYGEKCEECKWQDTYRCRNGALRG